MLLQKTIYRLISSSRSVILMLILGGALPIVAQDLEKDLKFFYAGFTTLPVIECEMVSKAMYRRDNSAFFDKKIKLVISHNQFYYNMGDMLYISNKDYLLWVDKTDKRIIVGKTDLDEIARFKKNLIKQVDSSSFKTNGEVIYEGIVGNVKTYRIVNLSHPYIKEAKITFDATTFYLKKMEIFFKEEEGVNISSSYTEFTSINTKPVVNESLFDQSAYIQVNKGVISLTPAYKNYTLIPIDHSLLNQIKK
jgi:hypothetical protein